MKLIFTRSPYFISVNEAGQSGAKVKLYIYNKYVTIPTTPTYILSKNIPSATQTELNFNISNYVREFINAIQPFDFGGTIGDEEDPANYCFVKVERYKTVSTVDTLLDTNTYVCTNGYNTYLQGANVTLNVNVVSLLDETKTLYYDRVESYPYFNILTDHNVGVKYSKLNGTSTVYQALTPGAVTMYEIPFSTNSANYDNGNLVQIIDTTEVPEKIIDTFKVIPLCENKYTPVRCAFTNALGGWQVLTFFKAQTNNINVKGSSYKMMPAVLDYDTATPQSKSFNINGKQTVKLNTGWVDENYSDIITQLLLSETILLDGKPVEIKTQSSSLKTSLQDKMINYEMEFEYAFNLINDVI
jgi:hypothetical protein